MYTYIYIYIAYIVCICIYIYLYIHIYIYIYILVYISGTVDTQFTQCNAEAKHVANQCITKLRGGGH